MRARTLLSAAAVLALIVSGCGGTDPVPPTVTGSPNGSIEPSTAEPAQTPTASADESTTQQQVPYADAPTTALPADHGTDYEVVAVRVGSHDGYDRVVVELSGGAAANLYWWAEYDADPRGQGKGDPVDVGGDAVLRVNVQGIAMPEPGDEMVSGLQSGSASGEVTGVYVDPMFESMIQIFIGLEQREGFHISTLDSPTRLVIDIEHP